MASVVSTSISTRRFYMQLLGTFAALAFILSSVGIYGIVSYSVAQRTREIGIRMAMGAKQSDVLRLVLFEGFRLAILGVMLGLTGAFAATRVLTDLLFQVKANGSHDLHRTFDSACVGSAIGQLHSRAPCDESRSVGGVAVRVGISNLISPFSFCEKGGGITGAAQPQVLSFPRQER